MAKQRDIVIKRSTGGLNDVSVSNDAHISSNSGLAPVEETSLLALTYYLADKLDKPQTHVLLSLKERFSVGALKALPRHTFDAALRYLIDQLPDDAQQTDDQSPS